MFDAAAGAGPGGGVVAFGAFGGVGRLFDHLRLEVVFEGDRVPLRAHGGTGVVGDAVDAVPDDADGLGW